MDVKQVLEELISIPDQTHRIASVYLDVRRKDEHGREAVRVFVREQCRSAIKAETDDALREGLEESLRYVEDYVAGLLRQQVDEYATGVAIFSCAPIGLFRVFSGRVPFQPMDFRVDRRPHIAPFMRAATMEPQLLVAAVDSEGGHIWEVNLGLVVVDTKVEKLFHGWHSQGGWRQRRIQQRMKATRERNLRATADPFVKIAEAQPNALLVVAAQHHILKHFEDLLPERVLSRIVAKPAFPGGLSETALLQSILDEAEPHIEDALRTRAMTARDVAIAEAARAGLGAVGVRDVLLALSEGRVHELVLDSDFAAMGWVCRNCAGLGDGLDSGQCLYCGGEVAPAELIEEIARRAMRTDVRVVMLPRENRVPGGHHMAALLRHRGTAQARLGGEMEQPALAPS